VDLVSRTLSSDLESREVQEILAETSSIIYYHSVFLLQETTYSQGMLQARVKVTGQYHPGIGDTSTIMYMSLLKTGSLASDQNRFLHI
jgi:hypothetical protein